MVRSIDPRCETLRWIQWPFTRPLRCLELASRKPSWPAFMCERTNRPDIWAQAIWSKLLQRTLRGGGRPHMDPGLRAGGREADPAAPAPEQRLLAGGRECAAASGVRDGGRPPATGLQERVANHRKRRGSKARVVSVAEKAPRGVRWETGRRTQVNCVTAHPTLVIGSSCRLAVSTKRMVSNTEARFAFAVLTTERKAA